MSDRQLVVGKGVYEKDEQADAQGRPQLDL
jgi:hypothetical protein